MKRVVLCVMGVLSVAGCGDVDESGSAGSGEAIVSRSEALVNAWTPWFSDDTPGSNGAYCTPWTDQSAITGAACSGSYCDNMRLYCGALPAGFSRTGGSGWVSPTFSDENPAGASCPVGYVMYGMQAFGSYADNLQIWCASATFPSQGVNCKWMPFFSEEQGTQYFDYSSQSYAKAVAIAAKCSGSYCDNLSFYVCEPRCTSHSDCFSACNFSTGQCTVG